MKAKLLVLDLELSTAQKRWLGALVVPAVILAAAGAALAGPPPLKTWKDGEVLLAADLNQNFGALAAGTVPTGAVMFFNLAACPMGWSDFAQAQGRTLVGVPANGTLGATVGTALGDAEDRGVPQHTHGLTDPGHGHGVSDPGHAHGINDPGHQHGVWSNAGGNPWYFFGGATFGAGAQTFPSNGATTGITIQGAQTGVSVNAAATGISVQSAGAVAGTNAPYVQLRACQKG